MAKYVGAVDQGTTSTRFMIFDHKGAVVGYDQKEHEQIYPKPGWVEHNPLEIWQATQDVIKGTLEKLHIDIKEIAAVGVTNQRETTVVWEKATGKPVYNAIVWQDTRTDLICNELAKEGGQDKYRTKVGLPLATYFSGMKAKWVLDNVPGVREKAEKGEILFGNIDTWVIWNLTGGPKGGVHVTDVSNASRTFMMNLETLDWDPDMLKDLGIPRAMLPTIKPSSEVYGYCQNSGLDGIPVAGDLGDQQAALFGQTCYDPGEAKNTYGTGCFMLMNTGTKPIASKNKLLTTIAWRIGGKMEYALEGSVFIAGAVVQWLRDGLGIIESSAEVEKLAASVPDTGGVYLVPAFAGLGAPHWDAYARGTIVGITRGTGRGHIARAALESIALQVADILHAMQADSGIKLKELRVDGGASLNNLLMQMQADLLGVPVVRPKVNETTALGAACLAGLATGFWKNQADIAKHWKADMKFTPKLKPALRTAKIATWQRALARAKAWDV